MFKTCALLFTVAISCAAPIASFTPAVDDQPVVVASSDVESIDAILAAVYDVISGPAGGERDWERFHSLFHSSARLMPVGPGANGVQAGVYPATPAQYIEQSTPFFAQSGFYESEIARRVERFGHIAHVFSTYSSRRDPSDAEPFMRGINSIQLLWDGERWWVLTILWNHESPDTHPLPEKYLPAIADR